MIELAQSVQGASGVPSSVRVGIVESVDPLTVSVQGVILGSDKVGILAADLAAGDTVAVLGQSPQSGPDPSSWLVLGRPYPSSSPPPGLVACRAWQSTAQSLVSGTSTPIPLETTSYDSGALHSTAVNNTRITVPVDGLYSLKASCQWVSNVTGRRIVAIRVDGTTLVAELSGPPNSGQPTGYTTACDWPLLAGQYVELMALQQSGGLLNTQAAEHQTWLSVHRIGPLP